MELICADPSCKKPATHAVISHYHDGGVTYWCLVCEECAVSEEGAIEDEWRSYNNSEDEDMRPPDTLVHLPEAVRVYLSERTYNSVCWDFVQRTYHIDCEC